jgi:hypothetical protein
MNPTLPGATPSLQVRRRRCGEATPLTAPPVPLSPHVRWREWRARLLPKAVFALTLLAVCWLWRICVEERERTGLAARIAPGGSSPQLPVTSPADGLVGPWVGRPASDRHAAVP